MEISDQRMSGLGGPHKPHPSNALLLKIKPIDWPNVSKWQRQAEWEPGGSALQCRTFFSIVCSQSLVSWFVQDSFLCPTV